MRRCVDDAGLEIADISGVCVGLPGVVERAAGVCRQSPIFSERDVPFGADLTDRLGVPASIDSDVNLVTLAEHWFGQARDLNDFLVVNVERSLGLGILHNGELFRGANGLSPDLGDLMVGPPSGGGGRLADVASESSVLSEAEALIRERRAGRRAFAPARGMALFLQRAADGDKRCARVLAAAGEALGFAIANLITLFAPPKVIISGRAMATSEYFIGPSAQNRRSPPAAEPRRRLRHRRARMERRKLGAGRRGHDAARSLWRAMGNDRARADSRSAGAAIGEL